MAIVSSQMDSRAIGYDIDSIDEVATCTSIPDPCNLQFLHVLSQHSNAVSAGIWPGP